MRIANHWAVPGFTCLAMLALSACSGGGTDGMPSGSTGGAGGGGGGDVVDPPVVDFVVPNSYATAGSDKADKLDGLLVFGDSYSDTDRNPEFDFWHERLAADADANLESFAVGEASARGVNVYYKPDSTGTDPEGDDPNNTFENQIDRWLGTTPSVGTNDLTVVYMGYNDVNVLTTSKLGGAFADYTAQVQRLIDNGATAGDRRIFLTLIHDWDSTPTQIARFERDMADGGLCDRNGSTVEECHYKRLRSIAWNEMITGLANSNDNIVAVDLFTVFDRIIADPSRFGFVNVTSVDATEAAKEDGTALYFDGHHFGAHGQDIVAQVFRHYLTRGWDWANQLESGNATVERLGEDIDNGLLLSLSALSPEQRLGLNSFVLGSGVFRQSAEGNGSRASFEAMRDQGPDDMGFGINYAFTPDTMMGVAISSYQDDSSLTSGSQTAKLGYESNSVSLYFNTELSGVQMRTVASFSDDQHVRQEHDALVGQSDRASFGGQTMGISQTFSVPMQVGQSWLTPWFNLSHTQQELDSYTISNPYLSDLTYKGDTVSETYATLGLSGTTGGFVVGDDSLLSFDGRVSYSRSLQLDDYQVTIREAALGYSEDETLKRGDESIFGLRLGTKLAVGQALSLNASYELSKQTDVDPEHSLMLRVNYQF